nr:udp-glycosyltransferase 89a2 [Quercus suber]
MSSSYSSQSHILVFPYPAQGHMLPLLDLTHQLSLRGLTITILVTPKNLPTLTPLLSSNPSIQTLVLPFPPHPQLPHGIENVRDVGNAGNLPIMAALPNLYDPLLHWFTSHPSPPIAIISDFFLGWTLRLANQLNIPRIVFFSSGAFLASVLYNLWPATNAQALRSLSTLDFPDLPGSPTFKQDHLPSVWRFYNESNPETHFIKDGMLANTASWGCVFNSFHELEGHYLDYLIKNSRVYGVGPLSLVGITSGGVGRGNPDSHSGNDDHVKTWLDGCLEGSVLYVCFGSQKMLNKQQVEGLAFPKVCIIS